MHRSKTDEANSLSNLVSLRPVLILSSISALSKTSIAVHQWTAKQFWVDRQSFKQKDNVYCLEKAQMYILGLS
jgi:hypothetical protein